MNNCPLFTVKPLSTVRVANVEVKIVFIDGEYHAGAIAHLVDYMDLLDHQTFVTRHYAEAWMNSKVRELFEACNHTHIPAFKMAS